MKTSSDLSVFDQCSYTPLQESDLMTYVLSSTIKKLTYLAGMSCTRPAVKIVVHVYPMSLLHSISVFAISNQTLHATLVKSVQADLFT